MRLTERSRNFVMEKSVSSKDVSMNYEITMGSFGAGQVAVLESKIQAISLLEARVQKLEEKLEDKNRVLRLLLAEAIEADESRHVMGEKWHVAARGIV